MFLVGAAAVLVASFVLVGRSWRRSRFEGGVDGLVLPDWLQRLRPGVVIGVRILGLGGFAITLAAALGGRDVPATNLAPTAVYVIVWVGGQIVAGLVGDFWKALSPFDTLTLIGQRLRGGARPGRSGDVANRAGYWPAAVGVFGFAWLELVHPDPGSPRALGQATVVYIVAVLAGAAWFGRAWLRRGEAFAAWFGLLASMAPLYRDVDGALRWRPPLTGLGRRLDAQPGALALITAALGSTTFDGVTRAPFFVDIAGGRSRWGLALIATMFLVCTILVVAATFLLATRLSARAGGVPPSNTAGWFLPSLIPIALGYVIAHYFSLLVFQGQALRSMVSDPFGFGWNLFGTRDTVINYLIVSGTAIAWVMVVALVVGHVAAVVVAHDRAVARVGPERAVASQFPLLGIMLLYTLMGLVLLLE